MTHISVALCTCNGARYLEQQLESIAAQTRLPNELVLCDDVSEDETFAFLESFQRRVNFPVRLYRNRSRVGATRNFSNAIALCEGDLIALSDQDDCWQPHKLDKIEAAFNANSDTQLVFSDLEIVDSELQGVGYTMWEKLKFKSHQQRMLHGASAYATLLKQSVVTGAATVFLSNLRSRILPIPDGWIHDQWIAFIAAAQGRIVGLPEPLVLYRQHDANLIGGRKEALLDQFTRAANTDFQDFRLAAKRYRELADRLRSAECLSCDEVMPLVEGKIDHLAARANLPQSQIYRFFRIMREVSGRRYSRFSNGWKSAARDLLL